MLRPDLDPLTQVTLFSIVVLLTGVILVRVLGVLLTGYRRSPHRYPGSWSSHQSKIFERFRTSIGVALVLTWVILRVAAPRMPQSWPFGREEMVLTVSLLLLTNAWLLLLMPSNWAQTIVRKVPFGIVMGVLAWWWVAFLGGTLVAISLATWRPPGVPVPIGTYAEVLMPTMTIS